MSIRVYIVQKKEEKRKKESVFNKNKTFLKKEKS